MAVCAGARCHFGPNAPFSLQRWRYELPPEAVGLHVGPSEAEAFWSAFLKSLVRRGLRGVKLGISGAHEGLKGAIRRVMWPLLANMRQALERWLHTVHGRLRCLPVSPVEARTCGIPAIETFAAGLETDGAAVRAALAETWSSGQAEGQANRLKLPKRQSHGRAAFDLLRKRVLLAA